MSKKNNKFAFIICILIQSSKEKLSVNSRKFNQNEFNRGQKMG